LLVALKDAWVEHHLMVFAGAVAFRVLISLVPVVLLALGLLGALGLEDVWTDSIAPEIQDRVTAPVFTAIDFSVDRIFASSSAALIVFASLLLLWELSRAVRVIMVAFNEIHEVEEHRSWARLLGVTLGLAISIGIALVVSMLVVTVLPRLAGGGLAQAGLTVTAWAVTVVVLGVATGLLVRYAPADKPQPRWASAGSALVVGTWVAASLLFGWYAGSIANYESAAGAMLVFLLLTAYVLVSSAILLVGVLVDERARWEAGDKR
jgi:membrane protein